MRILAVDDEPFALEVLSMLVINSGYPDIVAAPSAGAALERITEAPEPFQCIFLDIMMPVMEGIEFCDLVRRLPGYDTCQIIMLTAMNDRKYMDQAYEAGANDYVIKPFDANDIESRLNAVAKALS
ncbi:response regulator [Oceaniglobus ichthyenteri]|uniref:response regulator n=1 Tax=Oceaniglobus ichthyenteri TaxID=2136177 RepID=UPI000D33451D|nr:response regulator [Oceaniglobus ichthyenteri]